jgi:hypothetical protein
LLRGLDSSFEDAVGVVEKVVAGDVGGDVGWDADADELVAVGEAVVLGADAGTAAAGEIEDEGLAGAASGGFADDGAAFAGGEEDEGVFRSGEGVGAGEHDDLAAEVVRGVGMR